jgi:hypothetical protein
MTISEIIKVLQTMPQDSPLKVLYDGAVRASIDGIYLSQSGDIVGTSIGEPAYADIDRPKGAPSEEEDQFYKPIK